MKDGKREFGPETGEGNRQAAGSCGRQHPQERDRDQAVFQGPHYPLQERGYGECQDGGLRQHQLRAPELGREERQEKDVEEGPQGRLKANQKGSDAKHASLFFIFLKLIRLIKTMERERNFNPDQPGVPIQPEVESVPEKIVPQEPRLRYIEKVSGIMRSPEENHLGEERNWRELYKDVKPFSNTLELADNIRETVRHFVEQKIPKLKEAIPTISELDDKGLLEALSNNWFEEIEDTSGQRREVLMTVAAHIARRVETTVYKNILENATEEQLTQIGLDKDLAGLLSNVLDTSVKADPLFVRFLAYTQLGPEAPEGAKGSDFYLPEDKKPKTAAQMFPHETQFLSKRFMALAENSSTWQDKPGADIFKNYLNVLGRAYAETDPVAAEKLQEEIKLKYAELVDSEFPIIITPGVEGYYKEPYIDPEIRVSLATPDSKKEEEYFGDVRKSMAESLEGVGLSRFSQRIQQEKIRSVIAVGSFGVDLIFSAVAQEDPAILMYLNEQIRQYDQNFPKYMGLMTNTKKEFAGLSESDRTAFMEKISRTNVMMHEFSHAIFPPDEIKKFGAGETFTVLDEVKAETAHRALIPRMIKNGGLEGTKEQWALGLVASSLQLLKDQPEDDPYYYAGVYTLNECFKDGSLSFDGQQITVNDFDGFYNTQRFVVGEVASLYENPNADETRAANWLKQKCTPNETVKQLTQLLKKEEE